MKATSRLSLLGVRMCLRVQLLAPDKCAVSHLLLPVYLSLQAVILDILLWRETVDLGWKIGSWEEGGERRRLRLEHSLIGFANLRSGIYVLCHPSWVSSPRPVCWSCSPIMVPRMFGMWVSQLVLILAGQRPNGEATTEIVQMQGVSRRKVDGILLGG